MLCAIAGPTMTMFSGGVAAAQSSDAAFTGEGQVVAVDASAATVTLDHGPIPPLMPPMRMRFTVDDPASLKGLNVGDVVRFSLGSRGEQMVIVTIDRLGPGAPERR
jgi:Cu/Ag efflux protein CusF